MNFYQDTLAVSFTQSHILWTHACKLIGNLTQEEVGKPILDVILEPGDLLYFPRGTFHQVRSLMIRCPQLVVFYNSCRPSHCQKHIHFMSHFPHIKSILGET